MIVLSVTQNHSHSLISVTQNRRYSPISLTHNRSYSPISLTHNRSYSPISLTHNRSYSPISLTHNRSYSPISLTQPQIYIALYIPSIEPQLHAQSSRMLPALIWPDTSYLSTDKTPSEKTPGFALHPSGSVYVPVALPTEPLLTSFEKCTGVGICHPISIPVDFGGDCNDVSAQLSTRTVADCLGSLGIHTEFKLPAPRSKETPCSQEPLIHTLRPEDCIP